MVYWFDDKELSSGADAIGLNFLSKKKKKKLMNEICIAKLSYALYMLQTSCKT